MNKISLIIGYYRNSNMLLHQLDTINSYSRKVFDNLEVIIIDDGSPDKEALPVLEEHQQYLKFKPNLYKIMEDVPWNQVMARNLGAHVSSHDWIIFLDIDHIIPATAMDKILKLPLKNNRYYTFGRYRVTSVSPFRYHERNPSNCIFLINKHQFFKVGAYDEDFCGNYGYSDAWFKHRAEKVIMRELVSDIKLFCFHYTSLPDAQDMTRDRNKIHNRPLYNQKISGERPLNENILRLPWKKIL